MCGAIWNIRTLFNKGIQLWSSHLCKAYFLTEVRWSLNMFTLLKVNGNKSVTVNTWCSFLAQEFTLWGRDELFSPLPANTIQDFFSFFLCVCVKRLSVQSAERKCHFKNWLTRGSVDKCNLLTKLVLPSPTIPDEGAIIKIKGCVLAALLPCILQCLTSASLHLIASPGCFIAGLLRCVTAHCCAVVSY